MVPENEENFEQENASLQNEYSFEDENLAVYRQESGSKLIKRGPEKDLVIDITSMIKSVEPPLSSACCIYRVSYNLQEVNKAAYTPVMVANGPLHHRQKHLKEMEKKKIIYLEQFLQHASMTTRLNELGNVEEQEGYLNSQWKDVEIKRSKDFGCLKDFVGILKSLEDRIRKSYAENLNHFTSEKFVKIFLVDAAFIIELFLRFYFQSRGDTILSPILLRAYVRHDLMILENQLPFFVLRQLYESAFGSYSVYPSFCKLACHFFRAYNDQGKSIGDDADVKHFTDLLRTLLLPPSRDQKQDKQLKSSQRRQQCFPHMLRTWSRSSSQKPADQVKPNYIEVEYLHSATRLHEAGVKLSVSSSKCLLDINFSNGRLEIPCLHLTDESESVFRNLMALEQYHYPYKAFICDYIALMNNLINSNKDADLLEEKKIIHHWLGHSGEVASLFNKLCTNIIKGLSDRHYSRTCLELNAYYEKPWHSWKATPRHQYFSTPWRSAATIAAIIILVLTLVQTILTLFAM